MIGLRSYLRGCIAGSVLLFVGVEARAQAGVPSRMARLTSVDGYVHIDRLGNLAEATAGDPAVLNMPLVEGQTVVTGDNGQAEVEFEDGSLARLTPNSALSLAHLMVDGNAGLTTQLVLARGLAYFELRAAPRLAYTVAAGADRITPVENTTFRVNLDEPTAVIAVLDGSAHVERGGTYQADVHAGESFHGDPAEPSRYLLTQEIAPDSWDQWNASRDQMAADAASQNTAVRDNYAGTQGYGWSDLDTNGRWYDVPGQGEVWQPNGGDAFGFDPYGNGNWLWYPGAGYVFASSFTWGWTPFRCGGWSYWDTFGWGWTPNAACGGFGFAGYGGFGGFGYASGYRGFRGPFNILLPPLHYMPHRPPVVGVGGLHPVIAVHEGSPGIQPSAFQGTKTIAGSVARPLNPGVSYVTRGDGAGSTLRRDYPVDRATHTAVLGVQSGRSVARQGYVANGPQLRGGYPAGQRPIPMMSPAIRQPEGYPAQGASPRPTVQGSARPTQSYTPRPVQNYAPHGSTPAVPHPSFSAPSAPHVSAPSGGGGHAGGGSHK